VVLTRENQDPQSKMRRNETVVSALLENGARMRRVRLHSSLPLHSSADFVLQIPLPAQYSHYIGFLS
jgi:hypothetical protein